jgi:glycosyltransferase involved in cell wall biosynthesis
MAAWVQRLESGYQVSNLDRGSTGIVVVIIPALNEEGAIPLVLRDIPPGWADRVIVVDNGSTDATAEVAASAGATVIREPRRGYGYACLAGTLAAGDADVIAFLDGDHSFDPAELPRVVGPVLEGRADLVLGSRALGWMPNATLPHQRFGNWLTARLMRVLYGLHVTDLGPFRAIRHDLLLDLGLREMTFGWPTEMMIKATQHGARIVEVPVSYRPRAAGQSKVSGTVRGTVVAGYRIISTTLRYAWR